MKNRIKSHVEEIFSGLSKERRVMEIKEELLSNLSDKYDDLIARGKSEDEAYSVVISSIGDIYGLLGDVGHTDPWSFINMEKRRNLKNLFVSLSVSLYILGFVVAIISDSLFFWSGDIGPALMFLVWAVATGMLVYGLNMGKINYKGKDDSFVEQYKVKIAENSKESQLRNAATSSLWAIILVAYFALSFLTGQWQWTWILFLVGGFLQQLIVYKLSARDGRKNIWYGMFWSMVLVVYFLISFLFEAWAWSWMLFLAAVAMQQILRLWMIWKGESE